MSSLSDASGDEGNTGFGALDFSQLILEEELNEDLNEEVQVDMEQPAPVVSFDDTDITMNSSIALGCNYPADDGERDRNWNLAMKSFKSHEYYEGWWYKFIKHCSQQPPTCTFEMNGISFLHALSDEPKGDGTKRYKGTTVLSVLSVMKKGALYCCNIRNLDTTTPQLADLVKKLLKVQAPAKKASILTKEEINRFFNLVDTAERLLDKVIAALALAFAARKSELKAVRFQDVTLSVAEGTGERCYKVTHERLKTTGLSVAHVCFIVGFQEVKSIGKYMDLFPTDMTGTIFRKLKVDKNGDIKSTLSVVGIHRIEDTGKRVAKDLDLKDPKSYHSHTFRGSAINMCVEAQLPIAEIKLLTGHQSDKVLDGYIQQSAIMKRKVANVLSVGGQQCDEEGRPLQKKISSPASGKICLPASPVLTEEKMVSNVYNVTFSNCTGVDYKS
mmetsp:Transcript_25900/g.24734  ORF Transcript_25900/g.24734 Transcript_25900/m.24734 type:complete len:444 (+) Transcript_25900:111-1442(+)|eukprot:CAMPEP_0119053128 /NCGR_PEP_ID=MMETSP1177-20130426/74219_1 /TAXON_ID=2985 /ORGANISM="Ochromonas sp, Strain CCMP1899" /LENGTH=443 /DNA_ID=CAMNT_0007032973 /DNA_START=110 /DNA_END=1441 /DNA_ORIENTATION=-